jgi:hypothetical protein
MSFDPQEAQEIAAQVIQEIVQRLKHKSDPTGQDLFGMLMITAAVCAGRALGTASKINASDDPKKRAEFIAEHSNTFAHQVFDIAMLESGFTPLNVAPTTEKMQ